MRPQFRKGLALAVVIAVLGTGCSSSSNTSDSASQTASDPAPSEESTSPAAEGDAAVVASTDGEPIDCSEHGVTNDFGGIDVQGVVFDGDVLVPNVAPDAGMYCVFIGSTINGDLIIADATAEQGDLGPGVIFYGADGSVVDGDVIVGVGSDFTDYGATITGDVECDGCGHVEIAGGEDFDGNPFTTEVQGSVTVRDATAGAIVEEAIVGGDVTIVATSAPPDDPEWARVAVADSQVGGDVEFSANSAPDLSVANNTIGGDLACEANDSEPNVLAGNDVGGATSGQCG